MEDFSQLCHVLRSEYKARSIPFSLRDYARMCLESLADLISEDRPKQFDSAMGHCFAALYEGNELFNRLPLPARNDLNNVTIGIPPRRLFELLNDFARVINELSLAEMSSKTLRLAFEENGFPYRPNEFFSLIEQAGQLNLAGVQKPGPEFYKRSDGKAAYFKVWACVQKPGNAKKSFAEIVRATSVNKNRVPEILSETRPPTPQEIEEHRTTAKKR
jgi:hypothetical protein